MAYYEAGVTQQGTRAAAEIGTRQSGAAGTRTTSLKEEASNMKALYLTGKAQVEMREVPVPGVPMMACSIKIDSVGLCGSDVRTYSVGSAKSATPWYWAMRMPAM